VTYFKNGRTFSPDQKHMIIILRRWGKVNKERDRLIREAYKMGIWKVEISESMGIARTTIDRVVGRKTIANRRAGFVAMMASYYEQYAEASLTHDPQEIPHTIGGEDMGRELRPYAIL
jgi:hypothetical protein